MRNFLTSRPIRLAMFGIATFVNRPTISTGDWPGILGPTRSGIADSSCTLPDTLPSELKPLWKSEAGQGYAGASIAGNDIVLFERSGNIDRVRLLNTQDGRESWHQDLPARYRGGIDADKGPRCVPTITRSTVLVYSASGDLTLLSRSDGSILWTRTLRVDYEADDGYFGAGSTPLIVGETAIVNVGGKTANIVCVSLVDGKSTWTAGSGEASYASPILKTPKDSQTATQVIVPTRLKTMAIDSVTGKELWQVPFGQRGPTVNAATPIQLDGGALYLTASYGIGSVTVSPMGEIVRKGTEISSQYASPVALDGKIFGCDGREDGGTATLKCVDQKSGKPLWEQPDMPICHTLAVGDKVLVLGIDGRIWALSQNATTFTPLWKSRLPKGVFRALPAISDNKLFVRTSSGSGDSWYCFDLR